MHQITVSEEYNTIRLDAFLAQQEGVFSRSRSQDMISNGYVSINDNTITKLAKKVREGDTVSYDPELFEKEMVAANTLEPVDMKIQIVFENDDYAIIIKPPYLSVHPSDTETQPTLAHGLMHQFGSNLPLSDQGRPGLVHRLDKDTSGLMIIVKNAESQVYFQKLIAKREIEKYYKTLVYGNIPEETGTINQPLYRDKKDRRKQVVSHSPEARNAITHYTLESFHPSYQVSLVDVQIITGRTHQIRAHMRFAQHPVVGDQIYGIGKINKQFSSKLNLQRQFLHAYRLAFVDPSGVEQDFQISLYNDLQKVVDTLA